RQALGIVRILRGRGEWSLPIDTLVNKAAAIYGGDLGFTFEVMHLILGRLSNLLIEEGHRTEVVNAVSSLKGKRDYQITSLCAKVEALSQIVDQPDFAEIAVAAKRVLNILRQAEDKLSLDVSMITRPAGAGPTEEAERALAEALPRIKAQVAECWAEGDHIGAFRALARLRPEVDAFFDTVRVMDEDETKRDFRLALLAEFRAVFLDIADISQIAVEQS
ncbi:hypothetical protein JXA47_12310, partial [Candidatus Sumerlaeota bacterium]|nr:hypothetical protein [Candidatus Sumerlaeota bacterium]